MCLFNQDLFGLQEEVVWFFGLLLDMLLEYKGCCFNIDDVFFCMVGCVIVMCVDVFEVIDVFCLLLMQVLQQYGFVVQVIEGVI